MNNNIPQQFIIVKGSGQSMKAKHAGSYHLALFDAGISDYNIQTYSSVLPKDAELLSLDEIDLPPFGSELKCIMANAEGNYGDTISAGVIYAWMYKDEDLTEKHGGFVCELSINGHSAICEKRLREILQDGFDKTYAKLNLFLGEPEVITEEFEITEMFGNAIVAMCFLNFK
jgi:arginine decarboxylase